MRPLDLGGRPSSGVDLLEIVGYVPRLKALERVRDPCIRVRGDERLLYARLVDHFLCHLDLFITGHVGVHFAHVVERVHLGELLNRIAVVNRARDFLHVLVFRAFA